ncbi:MAG: hypothetical protein ACC634_11620, partial [Hyphomicrobiales bacterium]
DAETEKWMYLSGEYGGGSWAIERATGLKDVITISDLRLMLGIETKSADSDSFIEFGYIFDRKLEYRSKVGNFQPSETLMIRVGGQSGTAMRRTTLSCAEAGADTNMPAVNSAAVAAPPRTAVNLTSDVTGIPPFWLVSFLDCDRYQIRYRPLFASNT